MRTPRGLNHSSSTFLACEIWSKLDLLGVLVDDISRDMHPKHIKMLSMGWYDSLIDFCNSVTVYDTVYQANTVRKYRYRKMLAGATNVAQWWP